MLQIKTFPSDPQNIDDQVNEFLRTIQSDAVKSIEVSETGFAVIQYEVKRHGQTGSAPNASIGTMVDRWIRSADSVRSEEDAEDSIAKPVTDSKT